MGRQIQQFRNLQLATGLGYIPICIPFLDWWWVQALFCTGHNQEEECDPS